MTCLPVAEYTSHNLLAGSIGQTPHGASCRLARNSLRGGAGERAHPFTPNPNGTAMTQAGGLVPPDLAPDGEGFLTSLATRDIPDVRHRRH
jgi:hypothetical protein